MSQRTILNKMAGVAVLAMIFGTGAAYAQSSQGAMSGSSSGSMSQNSAPQSSGASADTGSSKSGSSSRDALSNSDLKMLDQLARTNMAEIEAAKIALNKSKDEQVRNFAQRMVDDHTKAQDQLKDLAQAKGVSMPANLSSQQKSEINKLSALSGDKFDKTYLSRGGVADHRQAHELLGRIEKQAKDADLKALAANQMPTINEHWKLAKQAKIENAGTTTGASGTKGSSASGKSSNKSSSDTSLSDTDKSHSSRSSAGSSDSSNAGGASK